MEPTTWEWKLLLGLEAFLIPAELHVAKWFPSRKTQRVVQPRKMCSFSHDMLKVKLRFLPGFANTWRVTLPFAFGMMFHVAVAAAFRRVLSNWKAPDGGWELCHGVVAGCGERRPVWTTLLATVAQGVAGESRRRVLARQYCKFYQHSTLKPTKILATVFWGEARVNLGNMFVI